MCGARANKPGLTNVGLCKVMQACGHDHRRHGSQDPTARHIHLLAGQLTDTARHLVTSRDTDPYKGDVEEGISTIQGLRGGHSGNLSQVQEDTCASVHVTP